MKRVVHNLRREDFSILVGLVIENLITKNDYRSSLVPNILIKHFDDLFPNDQKRLMNVIRDATNANEFSVDKKYWTELLATLEEKYPQYKKVPLIQWNPVYTYQARHR